MQGGPLRREWPYWGLCRQCPPQAHVLTALTHLPPPPPHTQHAPHTLFHTQKIPNCRGESKILTIVILAREEGLLAMSIELVTEEASVSIPLSCRVTA